MGNYTIKGQFEAGCAPSEVMKWISSPDGIAGWWSDTVEGQASAKGDRFSVRFPTTDVPFELEVTEAGEGSAEWHIAENPPWWKNTTIRFDISEADGGSAIMFSHSGFEPDDPIIAVITPAWVRFVDNLVAVAESGKANPAVVN